VPMSRRQMGNPCPQLIISPMRDCWLAGSHGNRETTECRRRTRMTARHLGRSPEWRPPVLPPAVPPESRTPPTNRRPPSHRFTPLACATALAVAHPPECLSHRPYSCLQAPQCTGEHFIHPAPTASTCPAGCLSCCILTSARSRRGTHMHPVADGPLRVSSALPRDFRSLETLSPRQRRTQAPSSTRVGLVCWFFDSISSSARASPPPRGGDSRREYPSAASSSCSVGRPACSSQLRWHQIAPASR